MQLESLFTNLGTPEPGRQLVIKARRTAPVREVKSNDSNVITLLASRKMEREIATESYKVEYVASQCGAPDLPGSRRD